MSRATNGPQLFIRALSRALDLASFYEPGDRVIGAIVDPVADTLAAADPGAEVRIEAHGSSLLCAGTKIEGDDATVLRRHLVSRKILTLDFPPYVDREELWVFLVLLATDPEAVAEAGGLSHCLLRYGATNVVVNGARVLETPDDDPSFQDPPWAESPDRGTTRIRES